MKTMFNFFLIICLAGCSTFSQPITSKTFRTHYGFEKEIRLHIDILQKTYAPQCPYRVMEIRVIGFDKQSSLEEWVVMSCGEKTIFPVEIKTTDDGFVYFIVSTPKKYQVDKN